MKALETRFLKLILTFGRIQFLFYHFPGFISEEEIL